MKCPRDFQRSRMYKWENENVPQGAWIDFNDIEAYVKQVWAAEGLLYPPLVQIIRARGATAGDATRNTLRFPEEGASEAVILHEIAHAMTSNVHEESDAHGPTFTGVFIDLVAKHMNVSKIMLWHTAQKAGVKFDMFAKPTLGNVE